LILFPAPPEDAAFVEIEGHAPLAIRSR
jgi:hypothetical protein